MFLKQRYIIHALEIVYIIMADKDSYCMSPRADLKDLTVSNALN